jgi:hypothetical protein
VTDGEGPCRSIDLFNFFPYDLLPLLGSYCSIFNTYYHLHLTPVIHG